MSTIHGIRGVPGFPASERTPGQGRVSGGASFGEVLGRALQPGTLTGTGTGTETEAAPESLTFSAHARARLESRGIDLGADDLRKLEEAVDRAGAKGSRDTLLVLRGAGFIVNVPSRTVVTAVDEAGLRERVFTNIDSTVWVE